MTEKSDAYLARLRHVTVLDGADPTLDSSKVGLTELAHIGGQKPVWIGAAEPVDMADPEAVEPVFVCYFTRDTPYEALAGRLRASLDRFGLAHRIVGIDTLGSWERNCALKARFVRDQWRELGRPVVWLDADATVEADPVLLRHCGADFAVSKSRGWEMGSGTLFFGQSEAAEKLLDRWVLRCEADPLLWDQMHLDAAWADIAASEPLVTQWLPQSYLFIFDHEPVEPPVITHWQASRENKVAVSGGVNRPKPHIPESLEVARRFSRFSRAPESLFWAREGVAHIKPEIGMEHPEGFDVPAYMRELAGDHVPLVEVGCGVGRLAGGFAPSEYIGVDINPHALPIARMANPDHDFRLITEELDYPTGAALLFYTVLLHVPDAAILATLEKAARAADRIIICEVMDRRWRREGDPPVFNRETEDYIMMMQSLGYRLTHHERRSYQRYDTEQWWNRRDTRLANLVFDRT